MQILLRLVHTKSSGVMGAEQEVAIYALSDFARTATTNGDDADHAWGGYALVVGGGVNEGGLFGELPNLTLGGPDDFSARGRMIPRIASNQYQATLIRCFGADETLMSMLFPNRAPLKTL